MCMFDITVPWEIIDKDKDERFFEIKEILDRNNVTYGFVDTVPGSWNLNDDYLETDKIECIVEYCGVYPVHWNINDVVRLEELHNAGKLVINVCIVDEAGNYIPNE